MHTVGSTVVKTGTALIVDLESRNLYEVCKTFRDVGYRTFGTSSFGEAKRVLMAERPHVLVADVRLGEFNGLQLLMLARELEPAINVVITNAFPDPILKEETRRMGGTFLVKPIQARELLDAARVGSNGSTPARTERREMNRRVLVIPGFQPDRRVMDRRKA